MKNSQILLNSSPMFKLGAHERIFYGLGCGALVISNETPWLNDHFINGEDILMYQVKKLPEMNQKIKYLLNNKEERISCTRKGQNKVLLHHTWDVRAKELLNILSLTLPSFEEE